ncbi:MAG TPA: hypothetical protein VHD39_06745 [Acidimicrobiales bacterium]|nr:hypothetical protein [Acidimicrobiales bacterium]
MAGAQGIRGRAAVLAALVSVLVGPAAVWGSVSASAGASAGASQAPKLAQTGKVAFWECSPKTTVLLVAVNTLTLHPGSTLTVSFTVKNGGSSSCNYTAPYASVSPGPTTTALQAGPCGSIGFEIMNASHHKVWPGAQVVNCPALGFAQLAPGATVSGTGTWNQTKPNSTSRVPAGHYTLIVDNKHFSFKLTVAKT